MHFLFCWWKRPYLKFLLFLHFSNRAKSIGTSFNQLQPVSLLQAVNESDKKYDLGSVSKYSGVCYSFICCHADN